MFSVLWTTGAGLSFTSKHSGRSFYYFPIPCFILRWKMLQHSCGPSKTAPNIHNLWTYSDQNSSRNHTHIVPPGGCVSIWIDSMNLHFLSVPWSGGFCLAFSDVCGHVCVAVSFTYCLPALHVNEVRLKGRAPNEVVLVLERFLCGGDYAGLNKMWEANLNEIALCLV